MRTPLGCKVKYWETTQHEIIIFTCSFINVLSFWGGGLREWGTEETQSVGLELLNCENMN